MCSLASAMFRDVRAWVAIPGHVLEIGSGFHRFLQTASKNSHLRLKILKISSRGAAPHPAGAPPRTPLGLRPRPRWGSAPDPK
eukprot:7377470-Prymnesium_polylepis.6